MRSDERTETRAARGFQSVRCDYCSANVSLTYDSGAPAIVADHDHVTGKFRGYLCRSCNVGNGYGPLCKPGGPSTRERTARALFREAYAALRQAYRCFDEELPREKILSEAIRVSSYWMRGVHSQRSYHSAQRLLRKLREAEKVSDREGSKS